MSTAQAPAPASLSSAQLPSGWPLWVRQVLTVVRIDLRKTLLGRRSLLIYAIASLPIVVMLFTVLVKRPGGEALFANLADARRAFAMIFQTLILRGIIFFGCVAFFSNLFRGEVLDRSLHYYLLSPLRRPVLVIAKFVSGLTITWVLFMGTTVISFLLIYPPFGVSRAIEDLFNGPGGGQMLAYAGLAMLACIGYGSVFMILGLWFKNPVVPAAAVFGWEALHFLLPPMLKRISVIHYLKGMIPIPMSEGPFAVVTDPPPVFLSIVGLLIFSVAVLTIAGLVIQRFEIKYADD